MRSGAVLMVVSIAACTFSPPGASPDAVSGDDDARNDGDAATIDGSVIDAAPIDAPTDAAIDAAPTDAAIDAAIPCPVGYTTTVGTARYARRVTPSTHATAITDCDDDLPGRTHLATFEGADLDAVISATAAGNSDSYYVGAECNTTGEACDDRAPWFWQVSATAVAPALWATNEPSQGLNHSFTRRDMSQWRLLSSGGTVLRGYICECDP